MMKQKEMDKIFIHTLESIIQVCNLITSGNISHYIPSIKGKCQSMIQFYKENPVSLWHDVKKELPNINIPVLVLTHNGNIVTASMYIPRDVNGNILGDKEWKGNQAFRQSITHWMEIPELP
nr:MAG TPA: Protein of unknown function (DUF551) [Caudoviricetes sp.]